MLMVTLVAKMIVEGFAQMITVLHGGGHQMVTVLHRGGLANDSSIP